MPEVPKKQIPRKSNKRDGYSKMAQIQNSGYCFDKESFVQAGMKFILKSVLDQKLIKEEAHDDEDPITPVEVGYLANLLDPNETVSWRDVI